MIQKPGLTSAHSLAVAGRHIFTTGSRGIEAFPVEQVGDYASSYHDAYRSLHVDASVPEGEAHAPFFDAPFLYWVGAQGVQRVRINDRSTQRSPETVVDDAVGSLTAAPATARIPLHGSTSDDGRPDTATQTHIAFPSRDGVHVLAMDRYHQVPEPSLHFINAQTERGWHTPVFDPQSSTWIVVDEDGAVLRLGASPVGASAPSVAERVDAPSQLVSGDAVRVGQPRRVGRCVFAVYWGANGQSGIARFNLDTDDVAHFAPTHISLSRDGGLNHPPLAYNDEGVIHPGADHRQALFVPVEGTGERALRLDGIERFHHRHTVAIGDRYVAWVPLDGAGSSSCLAEIDIDLQSRHLRGGTRLSFDAVSWDEVRALRYVAPTDGYPAYMLGQTRNALLYVYPKEGAQS